MDLIDAFFKCFTNLGYIKGEYFAFHTENHASSLILIQIYADKCKYFAEKNKIKNSKKLNEEEDFTFEHWDFGYIHK